MIIKKSRAKGTIREPRSRPMVKRTWDVGHRLEHRIIKGKGKDGR